MKMPSKDEILAWIRENPTRAGKREIGRAFGVKGADRIELKRLLRELADEGHIEKRRRSFAEPGGLPPVALMTGVALDRDGDLFAEPVQWEGAAPRPRALVIPKSGDPALGVGDRFLARLRPAEGDAAAPYEARLLKKLAAGPARALGIYRRGPEAGRLLSVNKRAGDDLLIPHGEEGGASDGDLCAVEMIAGPRLGLRRARVVEVLGDPGAPKAISLIAIAEAGLPVEFSPEALAEAEKARPMGPAGREDLRALPLITIDPADARDHDDAVAAAPDDDPANPGGWIVWVAIADVAAYVRPGSALDRDARARGNSCYFPDRVVPMLPEALSADLCSLIEGADRPCLAVRLILNGDGEKIGHDFHRGLMRSPAALAYEDAQSVADGAPTAAAAPHAEVIRPLFTAWAAAMEARARRAPLDLDLPERRILLDDAGEVTSVAYRDRLDAHKVIEEFMILANVAAAETLEEHGGAFLYRVHEEPNPEKLDALRETAESLSMTLARGQVLKTAHLNRLLDQARGTEHAETLNLSVLRAMTQAYYAPENYGHFGLALRRYAHFTSPIRRYSDLVVHRALIAALKLGRDGQTMEEREDLIRTGEHISMTERRAMDAERATTDRYLAAYLADREGAEFAGRVTGVARFGFFVKLDETGADGLVPVGSLGREYFRFDADRATLTGERSGEVIAMGARARVRLAEARPLTGGLIFEALEIEGTGARSSRRGARAPVGRRAAKSKLKKAKAARRAARSR